MKTWKGVIGRHDDPALPFHNTKMSASTHGTDLVRHNVFHRFWHCFVRLASGNVRSFSKTRGCNTFSKQRNIHKHTQCTPSMKQKSFIDFCIVLPDLLSEV